MDDLHNVKLGSFTFARSFLKSGFIQRRVNCLLLNSKTHCALRTIYILLQFYARNTYDHVIKCCFGNPFALLLSLLLPCCLLYTPTMTATATLTTMPMTTATTPAGPLMSHTNCSPVNPAFGDARAAAAREAARGGRRELPGVLIGGIRWNGITI